MPAPCCKEFFARIPDDVPVFTLVAYDALAVSIVTEWVTRAEKLGVNSDKLTRSKEHLSAMIKWRLENPEKIKIPD
jgi:hypothetical protein